jgi:hypothetical protein
MRLFVGVVCAALLVSCGSGPSKIDVTGTWEATIDYTTCTSENLDSRGCGYALSLGGGDMLTLTQTGNDVTGSTASFVVLRGRLSGESLTLDGSGTNPGSGSTNTQQWRIRVSGDRMTGTISETMVSPDGIPDRTSAGTSAKTGDVTGVRQK